MPSRGSHERTRPALTLDDRPDNADTAEDTTPPRPGASTGDDASTGAPGFREAIDEARSAARRLIDAHLALLRAEMAVIGREVGIIAGLVAGVVAIAVLVGILVVVGGFLFLGEWLFGSMGWGIIHGTLLGLAVAGVAAVDLAGGSVRSYAWGLPFGVIVAISIGAVLLLNVGNAAAEAAAGAIEDQLLLDRQWAPTLVGLVVGAVALAAVALFLGYRAKWRFGSPFLLATAGALAGGFLGAILASTTYRSPAGVVGLAIAIGLITWMALGGILAARQGFDPEARYAPLVPRRTIAAAQATRDMLSRQVQRQKDRFMGRS